MLKRPVDRSRTSAKLVSERPVGLGTRVVGGRVDVMIWRPGWKAGKPGTAGLGGFGLQNIRNLTEYSTLPNLSDGTTWDILKLRRFLGRRRESIEVRIFFWKSCY